MQFLISAPDVALTVDERAYVEFSLFSALRPFASRVYLVRVLITARRGAGVPGVIAGAVRADSAAGPIIARGSGDRIGSAVDTLARRLARAAEDAFAGAHTSPDPRGPARGVRGRGRRRSAGVGSADA